MSSDNNSLWGKAVLFGLSVGIAGLFVVAGNSTYVQTNNGNSSSEVRASQQKDAQQVKKIRELEQAKREDGAKIKELKEQVRHRVNELLETERKWKLSQSDP